MIVPRYYENLNVLHENTMPARAYYIPASRRMDNLVEHREESDRMQLLNGTWKFQYFNSIYDIQDSFFEKNYGKYVIICTLPFKKTCRPSGRHILFLLFGSKSFR